MTAHAGPQPVVAPRLPRSWALAVVAAGLAVTGTIVGAVWARITPPIHGVVALTRDETARVLAYLGPESDHFFTAAALMLGLLGAVAVVAAAAVWQWRPHRGPGMVVALSVGLVSAAGLATGVGALLVRRRYGVVEIDAAPVSADDRFYYFAEAPPVFFGHAPLQVVASLLVPAAAAALVYALCAAASARDDLGAQPPVDPPGPAVPGAVPPPPEVFGINAADDAARRR